MVAATATSSIAVNRANFHMVAATATSSIAVNRANFAQEDSQLLRVPLQLLELHRFDQSYL